MRIEWGVGDIVRKLREQQGWNQEVLADEAGVSLSTIQRLEDGRESKPETIRKVSLAFGVKVSVLMANVETIQEAQRAMENATVAAGVPFPDPEPPHRRTRLVPDTGERRRASDPPPEGSLGNDGPVQTR